MPYVVRTVPPSLRSQARAFTAGHGAGALSPLSGAGLAHAGPATSVVVTNCTGAGYTAPTVGTGLGLGTALATGNSITFACNPANGAAVGGKYVITVPQTASPAFDFDALIHQHRRLGRRRRITW